MLKKKEKIKERTQQILNQYEDAKNCTYRKGYINQVLYHCKTCNNAETGSGVCFACYVSCHLDHEAVELGLKQHFRCDCGTTRTKSSCSLEPEKELSTENAYNHNFRATFCLCDQEDDEENIYTLIMNWNYHLLLHFFVRPPL